MTRVVAITGASAGAGRAAALAFARRGDVVALIARSASGLDSARREIERQGGRCVTAAADVSNAAEVETAAARVEALAGPIDVWVNSAMVTVFGPVASLSPEEVRRVTEVTYLGTVNGSMAALRRMRRRDRGTIIQVGSALAHRAIPLQSAYCGAKFAIRGFTEALRTELLHDGSRIAVGMVQMPALNTPQFEWARTHVARHPRPVPPVYEPEVAADAILAMADRPRREIWVGGSSAKTIIANKLAPGLLDRYLTRNAYDAQDTGEPVSTARTDNLYRPVDGLHRTRGRFGRHAARSGMKIPVGDLSPLLLGAAGALAGLLAGALLARRR